MTNRSSPASGLAQQTEEPEPAIDGRSARRERGRVAVVDAMIELVFEGHAPPNADQVAERAGVSVASLFRYFDTLDDLRDAAAHACLNRFAHLHAIDNLGEGPLAGRIATLVDTRLALHETMQPINRLVRAKAPQTEKLRDIVRFTHEGQRSTIESHLAPELDRHPAAAREDLLTTVTTLVSFESWEMSHTSFGRSQAQIKRSWTTALAALLG